MRTTINVILLLLILVLIYMLYGSIREPIQFQEEKSRREQAVIEKLIEIRKAQELYRGVTGQFASSFSQLSDVLKSGKFKIIKVTGDPDDPTGGEVRYDTLYKAAIDSVMALRMNVDSLQYVPFGEGATFNIQADTLTYQSALVNVVEVGIARKVFMGKFKDPAFAKYDNSYDPNSVLKFGNMNAPNIAGNWE